MHKISLFALALCCALPVTAQAGGASCPPGYRLDDNDNCVKIPGGTPGNNGPYCGYDGEPCCNDNGQYSCLEPHSQTWCMGDYTCHNIHNQAAKCEQDYFLAQSAGAGTPVTCFASPICIGAFAAFQADQCDGCWWSYKGFTGYKNEFLGWMGGGDCWNASGVSDR